MTKSGARATLIYIMPNFEDGEARKLVPGENLAELWAYAYGGGLIKRLASSEKNTPTKRAERNLKRSLERLEGELKPR
jgi:hypothetical protein